MGNLRYAARQIVRRPVLSIIVVTMLAIGIGATTAMFSLVHSFLLQPLPVAAPDELVNLGAPGPKPGSTSCSFAGDCSQVFSYPMFRDLEAGQSVFTNIAGHRFFRANLSFDGRTRAGGGTLVSGGYFQVLGIRPAAGRLFTPADEPQVGESAVVVLSYAFWQSAFGGEDVIGATLVVNGIPLTIVGVAPKGFSGTTIGAEPMVFVPLSMRWLMEPTVPTKPDDRLAYWIYAFARLRPGVTVEQATAGINSLYSGILNDVEAPLNDFLPDDVLERFKRRTITITPGARGQSEIPSASSQPLSILFGLTAVVLLLVCVNIANLLLARAAARAGEFAIRASIGASPRHLLLQSMSEAAALAVLGGLLSIPLAALVLRGIEAMIPTTDVGAGFDIDLSSTAMIFAAAATLGTVLLFGLLPAIRATRTQPGEFVKGQAAQAASTSSMTRFRNGLATTQIAFSMLLLALAGLFTQSLANVARENLGFDADSIVSFTVSPRLNGYDPDRTMRVFDAIEDALAARPGVRAVSAARVAMIANNNSRNVVTIGGFEAEPTDNVAISTNDISTNFFATLGIPILAGREFEPADTLDRPRVAVVNQTFLSKFGLGMDAVGRRFGEGTGDGVDLDVEIVGIAADAKYSAVKDEVPPQYFLPRRQDDSIGTLTYYVRAAMEPELLFGTIRSTVASIDPQLPVASLVAMEQTIDENVFLDRMVAIFSAGFAVLATLVAAIGLYGVLAYNVAQRQHELGVRLALGATPSRLRDMVLGHVGRMALVGIALGLVAAVVVGRAAAALLFGLSGSDPVIFAASALVLAGVIVAAGWLPARRAARVAPMAALRCD